MQTPTVKTVLNPQTPGRRIGERVALLIAARKFLGEIPTKPTTEEK
jgi:hypothetical protein